MRDIKFRAWMPKENKWYRGGAVQLISMVGNSYAVSESNKWIIDLQQYTGLKDKNGVEIYEGDIVRCYGDTDNEIVGDIYWGKAAFHVRTIDVFWSPEEKDWEVIGNIYENPELLNDK